MAVFGKPLKRTEFLNQMRQTIKNIILWLRQFLRERFNQENPLFPYYLTILVSFIIFVVSLNVFVELTEDLKENELTVFDDAVSTAIQSFRTPSLTGVFEFITHLGDRVAYIIASLIIAAFFIFKYGKWKFALQSLTVLLLSSLSNIVLKRVINRERPALEHLVAVTTLSYPSGHSMSAVAFYGFLIYLSFRLPGALWFKIVSFIVLGLLILLIGISRVYLGVHYPSDVLAGFMGGLIWVAFCVVIFNVIDLYRQNG